MTYPSFSVGEVLTANDMNAVGMWKVTPSTVSGTGVSLTADNVTFTNSTEIICDGVFTSNYRNYFILWNAQTSAGGNIVTFQLRTATGTLNNNYTDTRIDAGAGGINGSTRSGQSEVRVGANDTNGWNSMNMIVYNPQKNEVTRFRSEYIRNSGTSVEQAFAAQTISNVCTGFRIAVLSGNMTGTLQIYGYKL